MRIQCVSVFCLRTDVAYEIRVGDSVILGDLGLHDEKDCASAFDLFGGGARDTEAMGEESTPFIRKGAFPDGCVGTRSLVRKPCLPAFGGAMARAAM